MNPAPPSDGLRLMVFDKTCTGGRFGPGLSHAWWAGAQLYHSLGRLDGWQGVTSWDEAFHWLATFQPQRPIAEIQYWGHGKWGAAKVGVERFGIDALRVGAPLHQGVTSVARRMLPGADGLWWFRTCETFGARPGHAFAKALSETLGCRTAGHTYIIGHWQSGLHSLMPGAEPHWSDTEALKAGTPSEPTGAYWSRAWAPNTINFLQGVIPLGY